MESGSADVWKDARKKKYRIYIEEYVMSYLRRESDSLELSEIYFYGLRQENGRKFYVYGAGRDKKIAAFAEYEPLPELVCRFTQAGPVFMVREADGECRANGFEIFYDNNDAMQNYLLEWTGCKGERQTGKRDLGQEKRSVPMSFPEEEKKRVPHRAMSVQLCLILAALVAIVITSTNSYDKMEELNRSAREVFFAIENQEAEETVENTDAREIVVERDTNPTGETNREAYFGGMPDERAQDADSDSAGEEDLQEESNGDAVEELRETESAQAPDGNAQGTDADEAPEGELRETESAETSDGNTQGTESVETAEEDSQGEQEEEALSRSITRYYEVEQGDTLYTISQKVYGDMDISYVKKICEVNQITDPDRIRSGQRIILP